jgi:hypothetical protein
VPEVDGDRQCRAAIRVDAVGPLRVLAAATIVSIWLTGCGSDAAAPVDSTTEVPTSEPGTAAPSSSIAADESTDETSGEPATWTIDPGDAVTAATTSFSVLVTRLGCADGVTGEVLDPVILAEADRVVISLYVDPLDSTLDYTCPTNDANAVLVHLDEPLGNRSLVDGACLGESPARQTSLCETGAVRLHALS